MRVDAEHANDVDSIDRAITEAKRHSDKPTLISVRTTIGYGSPRAGTYQAHGEPLGADNVKKTKEFFGWPTEPDFIVPDDVLAFWRERAAENAKVVRAWNERLESFKKSIPEAAAQYERMLSGKLPKLSWPTFDAENG